MGNPLQLLTATDLWPKKERIRIWLLSTAHRQLLSTFSGIDLAHLGVIPRDKLFRIKKQNLRQNLFKDDVHLVFSGRILKDKHVDLCLGVVFLLQEKLGTKVRFSICGPNLTKDERQSLKEKLAQYAWKIKPTLKGDLGADWHKSFKGNPILLNLSTYLEEDFGVSVAQAQEAGWPVIISNWGGHRDVVGPNCLKVPVPLIIHEDAEKIANRILKDLSISEGTKVHPTPKITTFKSIEASLKSLTSKEMKNLNDIKEGKISKKVRTILGGSL